MVANARLWHYDAGFFMTILLVIFRLCWRTITGKTILGDPRDNATFFHEANADFSGHPVEHLSGPQWKVALWRWIFVVVPFTLIMIQGFSDVVRWLYEVMRKDNPEMIIPSWTSFPWYLIAIIWFGTAVVVVASWAIYHLVYWIRNRRVINDFAYPTWETACAVMNIHYLPRDARRMVSLPEGFSPMEIGIEPEETEPNPILVWLLSHQKIYNLASRWLDIQREKDRLEVESEIVEGEVLTDDDDESEPTEPTKELVPAGHWPVVKWKRHTDSHALGVGKEDPEDDPVRINLPVGKAISEADKKRLVAGLAETLGMKDPIAKFSKVGRHPFLNLYFNHPPPLVVTFEDVRKYIEAADIDHPFIGLAYGGKAVYLDYVDESPHILISAKTGAGKSTLLKIFLSWRMHLGSGLMIADLKLLSHRWAHDLRGARYCWRIEDIHEMLVDLGLQLEWRKANAIPEGAGPDDPLTDFRTLDVVLEEMNSLSERLRTYWQEIRDHNNDPTVSPALMAIRDAINMGREFKIFMHIGAQRASANIFGPNGGDSRESFSTRLISGLSPQTWKILVPGVPFQAFPPGPRGIWGVVRNGELIIFRVPRLTNTEAQNIALSGIPSPGQPGYDGTANGPETVDQDEITEPGQITLNRAVVPGFLPGKAMTIGALRQATKRPGFPPAVGREGRELLYDEEALKKWKQARDKDAPADEVEFENRSPGLIYQFLVRQVNSDTGLSTGAIAIIGYVGKTRQLLEEREEQHLFHKPWADLIVGNPTIIWESEACTDEELSAMEQHYIRERLPIYNIEFQIGAAHAIPKWDQIEQRQKRQIASGLPPWTPRNIYEEARQGQASE